MKTTIESMDCLLATTAGLGIEMEKLEQYELDFDGATYDPDKDEARLKGQLARVYELMSDGEWRSLRNIADLTSASEASVSARLRDLRKDKFGGHTVDRERVNNGLHLYRLTVAREMEVSV